jgi:hypothetical protein
MYISLELAELGAADLLNQATESATKLQAEWDQIWLDVIGGGLWKALCQVGILFAICTLVFHILQFGKDLMDDELKRPLTSFIYPILVVILLSSNGSILASSTLMLRGYVNQVSSTILTITDSQVSLQEAYTMAKHNAAAQTAIGLVMAQCRDITGEAQIECLQEQAKVAQQILDAYGIPDNAWVQRALDMEDLASVPMVGGTLAIVSSGVETFLIASAKTLFIAFQIAFQFLLEVSLLLTALLAPIAVGGSLLPVGFAQRSLIAWLIGFLTVGFAKLCYNIIVGLTAVVMVNAESDEAFGFMVFNGVLAPILASSLASGAGLAVWQSLQRVGTTTLTAGIGALMPARRW